MMRLKKDHSGFTLVEAIVVGVIIAVLAAVAIPSYMGYINSTEQEAVDNLAQTAAAAANAYWRRVGSDPSIEDLDLFYDENKFTITVSDPDVIVSRNGKDIQAQVAFK